MVYKRPSNFYQKRREKAILAFLTVVRLDSGKVDCQKQARLNSKCILAMRFIAGVTMVPVVLQSCPFLCKQVDPVRVLYLDRLSSSDYNRLLNIRRFARLVFGLIDALL